MKAFGTYISKYLLSFSALLLLLLCVNAAVFGIVFHRTVREDYRDDSPHAMLEMTAAAATPDALSADAAQKLRENHIWAMYLAPDGRCFWSVELPKEVPQNYTVQDVASFSRGYLADYPVFVWNTDDGLLVLGYPKNSYVKLTGNYYSLQAVQKLPLFIFGMFGIDIVCLFLIYCFSRNKLIRSTEPIITAVETLADGQPASLCVHGELSGIAESVNKASELLNKQNEARANWISGISHDIRTPLSVIMGYAERIAGDKTTSPEIQKEAQIVSQQSVKIKELVQDLNLVSKLEYEMEPLHTEPVRLSKLIRTYAAELLNSGLSDAYTVEIDISDEAEDGMIAGDARLISRAMNNLVQNSIRHNPNGCKIWLVLERTDGMLALSVIDNGVGVSPEKLHALENTPHYMDSTDERLDLRHGLGLLIVQQIAAAHKGTFGIESISPHGCKATLGFLLFPSIR